MNFDKMQNEVLKNLYKEKDALSKRKTELQNELESIDSSLNKILSAEKKLTASFEKLGKEVSAWESLSAQLNTGTKKKRKKKDNFVDGSTATTDTEANVQFNNVNETFNPYGE